MKIVFECLTKRWRALAVAGLLGAAGVLAALLAPRSVSAASVTPQPFLKTDYSLLNPIKVPRPNVLFLLDTGSQMVFSPKGILPLEDDGRTQAERAELLKDCTYGAGARPLNEGTDLRYERWGRDLDNSNNTVGDPDCYYTPYDGTYPLNGDVSLLNADKNDASKYPRRPYFLTFRNSAYHVSPLVPDGTKVSGYPHYTQCHQLKPR